MDPIEQEIQAKGLTAPRIKPEDIEAAIAEERYFTAADGVLGALGREAETAYPGADVQVLEQITICVLLLRNGHRIVGVNEGPVSAENFDADLGRKLAREKALDQTWLLLGYELRSKLAAAPAVPPPKGYQVSDIATMMIERSQERREIDLTMTMTDGTEHKASIKDTGIASDREIVALALAEINSRAEA